MVVSVDTLLNQLDPGLRIEQVKVHQRQTPAPAEVRSEASHLRQRFTHLVAGQNRPAPANHAEGGEIRTESKGPGYASRILAQTNYTGNARQGYLVSKRVRDGMTQANRVEVEILKVELQQVQHLKAVRQGGMLQVFSSRFDLAGGPSIQEKWSCVLG